MSPKIQKRADFLINLVFYSAIAGLAYLGVKYALKWILPFVLAFAIVSALNPLVRFVTGKLKFSRKAATITVTAAIYALVGFALFELIMQAYYFMRDIFTRLPDYYDTSISPAIENAGENMGGLAGMLPEWAGDIEGGLTNALQGFVSSLSREGMSYVTGFTGQIPAFLIGFLFTIMLTFFIGLQYGEVCGFLKAQLPARLLLAAGELRSIMVEIVLRYFGALFKLMGVSFVELSVGLLALRAPNAILIALGIAIFDALPLFGTGMILLPWALFELVQGKITFALGLALLYVIVVVVRNIVEPHIVGRKLGLNPIVSIVSIYLGFRLFGVFGMIIMPITTQIFLELHKREVIKLFKSVDS